MGCRKHYLRDGKCFGSDFEAFKNNASNVFWHPLGAFDVAKIMSLFSLCNTVELDFPGIFDENTFSYFFFCKSCWILEKLFVESGQPTYRF